MEKKVSIKYRLRYAGEFLHWCNSYDYCKLGQNSGYGEIAEFDTIKEATMALCNTTYFLHPDIPALVGKTAKERLEMVEIVKTIQTLEFEGAERDFYLPTNLEIVQFYILAKGDTGLVHYLKSAQPFLAGCNTYEDGGYEFASMPGRLGEYTAWVKAGKPINEKKAKFPKVQEAIKRWCKL